jgi:hypothetical protein
VRQGGGHLINEINKGREQGSTMKRKTQGLLKEQRREKEPSKVQKIINKSIVW